MDKCPFCVQDIGSDLGTGLPHFTCDTFKYTHSVTKSLVWHRGSKCYETELAVLKAELDEVKSYTVDRDMDIATKDELLRVIANLFNRWLRNEGNHVFQNTTLQEETKIVLATPEVVKVMEGK